jgi:hypothetical protein
MASATASTRDRTDPSYARPLVIAPERRASAPDRV